jgi:hypothetical protein
MRANRNTFCTKWLEQSDSMSDELHQLEDTVTAAKRARDKYLDEHPDERKRIERLRDTAPMYRSNRPFSIWASEARTPAEEETEYAVKLTSRGRRFLAQLRKQEEEAAAAKAEHGGDAA